MRCRMTPTQIRLLRSAYGAVRVAPHTEAEYQAICALVAAGLLVAAPTGGYGITTNGIQALAQSTCRKDQP